LHPSCVHAGRSRWWSSVPTATSGLPYQRTFSVAAGMSQMCQQATSERKKGLLSRRP